MSAIVQIIIGIFDPAGHKKDPGNILQALSAPRPDSNGVGDRSQARMRGEPSSPVDCHEVVYADALHDEKLARAVSNAGRVVVVDLLAGLGQQREPIAPPPIFYPGSLSIRRSIVTPSGTGIRARRRSSSFTA